MESMIKNDSLFCVSRKMAAILGINEATVLGQIHYWISKNKENNINYKNGRYWTFNSFKKWHEEYFYFWSERTVKRIFNSLESKGILLVGNFNKAGYDRTKWYSIDYDKINEILEENSMTICHNATCQFDEMNSDNLSLSNMPTCHDAEGQSVTSNMPTCHDAWGQNVTNNTNINTNNTTVITQQPGYIVVSVETRSMLKKFLGDEYTDSYSKQITNILMEKGKRCDYLQEKIDLANSGNVENKCGFLMAAVQHDYKKVSNNKNKFINFEQTVYKYSKDELNEIVRRKNRF